MDTPLLVLERDSATVLENDEIRNIIDNLSDQEKTLGIDPETTIAKRFELPFYTDVALLELTSSSWQPEQSRLCFMEHGEELIRLNGTSPAIHGLNAKTGPVISEATVLEYLAFFCFFVRAEEGPFWIIDRLPPSFEMDGSEMKKLTDEFRKPMVWGQTPAGNWRASAMVYYSNAIFLADFEVQLSGMIEMKDDMPIMADLSQTVDAPLDIDPPSANPH